MDKGSQTKDQRSKDAADLLDSEDGRFLLGAALGMTVRHLRHAPAKLKPVSDLADMKLLGTTLFPNGFWHVYPEPRQQPDASEKEALGLANSPRGNLLIGQALRFGCEILASAPDVSDETGKDMRLLGETMFELGFVQADIVALDLMTTGTEQH